MCHPDGSGNLQTWSSTHSPINDQQRDLGAHEGPCGFSKSKNSLRTVNIVSFPFVSRYLCMSEMWSISVSTLSSLSLPTYICLLVPVISHPLRDPVTCLQAIRDVISPSGPRVSICHQTDKILISISRINPLLPPSSQLLYYCPVTLQRWKQLAWLS